MQVLRKGRGPNEYLSPYINTIGTDTVIVIDDTNSTKVSFFSLNKIKNCNAN